MLKQLNIFQVDVIVCSSSWSLSSRVSSKAERGGRQQTKNESQRHLDAVGTATCDDTNTDYVSIQQKDYIHNQQPNKVRRDVNSKSAKNNTLIKL